ncbi:hypothetical protein SynA1524_00079 [Synechococcus sp. A15-24]|nr:hypothetical protein SynA1524_00079 [Synechococcus sp. A15-24]
MGNHLNDFVLPDNRVFGFSPKECALELAKPTFHKPTRGLDVFSLADSVS